MPIANLPVFTRPDELERKERLRGKPCGPFRWVHRYGWGYGWEYGWGYGWGYGTARKFDRILESLFGFTSEKFL